MKKKEEIKYFNPFFKNYTDEQLIIAFTKNGRKIGISNVLLSAAIELGNRTIFKKEGYGK